MKKLSLVSWTAAVFLLLPHCAAAESSKQPAAPCIGYNEDGTWGWRGWFEKNETEGTAMRLCPPNTVFLGTAMGTGRHSPENAPLLSSCCRVPAEDLLTNRHVFEAAICPPEHVVTGVLLAANPALALKRNIRCTEINSDRYQLGTLTYGVFWGVSTKASFPWKEQKRIRTDEVPLAIRYGLSRMERRIFSGAGCVGDPPGSLLVGKRSMRCKGLLFRELQYRGRPGDPPKGTAVDLIPECRSINNVFSPDARCIE